MKQHNGFFSCRIKDTAVATCAVPVYYYNIWHTSHFQCHEGKPAMGCNNKKTTTHFSLKFKNAFWNQTELESVTGKGASLMKTCVFSAAHMSSTSRRVALIKRSRRLQGCTGEREREPTNNLTIKKPYHFEHRPHHHKAQTKLSLEWISL